MVGQLIRDTTKSKFASSVPWSAAGSKPPIVEKWLMTA
ncbi:hypothetical protein CLV76_1331 [Marivita geojedonensis]|nr:hypothetical protein CLV76_1331 [Marivita geojedonensis]